MPPALRHAMSRLSACSKIWLIPQRSKRACLVSGLSTSARGRDEVAFAPKKLGELPGKLGRVEPLCLRNPAKERNHLHVLKVATSNVGQGGIQGPPPAHANPHSGSDVVGKVLAGKCGNCPCRIGGIRRHRRNDCSVDAEVPLQISFGFDDRGNIRIQADMYFAPFAGVRQQASHLYTIYAKLPRRILLRKSLNVIEPGRPNPSVLHWIEVTCRLRDHRVISFMSQKSSVDLRHEPGSTILLYLAIYGLGRVSSSAAPDPFM